jgi:MoxR-like ATPase
MNYFNEITNEVKKAIKGKDRAIVTTLLAILANGNILIEDIPGVGKTTMAVAFSKALGLEYKRVQFTPDTLPSDITGFTVYNKEANTLTFNKGAIFCNLFLADELNRTSSRTQAALLEAMEENQVTVEGKSYKLQKPFSVIATQNPTGASGTQLLPDSQVDRFMIRLSMGYPDENAECKMLISKSNANPIENIETIVTKEQLLQMQNSVKEVHLSKDMAKYIVSLITATRNNNLISRGASPRATLALTDMAKAVAFAEERDYVVPRDVQNIFLPVLSHRIILSSEAVTRQFSAERVLKDILSRVKMPRI